MKTQTAALGDREKTRTQKENPKENNK
jgi:hypothetical protein